MQVDVVSQSSYWSRVAPDIRNIRDAADAFEAMLWEQVLKESFRTLPEGSFFNSRGEKSIYLQLVIWRLSEHLSKGMDTDIGRSVYEKFSQGYKNVPSRTIYNRRTTVRGGAP